jgi:hypothetical protein
MHILPSTNITKLKWNRAAFIDNLHWPLLASPGFWSPHRDWDEPQRPVKCDQLVLHAWCNILWSVHRADPCLSCRGKRLSYKVVKSLALNSTACPMQGCITKENMASWKQSHHNILHPSLHNVTHSYQMVISYLPVGDVIPTCWWCHTYLMVMSHLPNGDDVRAGDQPQSH